MIRRITAAAMLAFASGAVAQPFAYTYSDARFNGNQHLYVVNLATGATTDAGHVNATHIESLCMSPAGKLYGLQSGFNFIGWLWDLTTVPGTPIGIDTFSGRIQEHPGIAFEPSTGMIWNAQAHPGYPVVPGGNTAIYRMSPANAHVDRAFTGVLTENRFFDSLAINGAGEAYGADFANARMLYRVNLTNGTHAAVGPLGLTERNRLSDISFDSSGQLWAIAGRGQIYRISTATGAATLVSTIDLPNQFWMALAVIPDSGCYPNCDASTVQPILNINDFGCFMNRFAAGESWANCDGSSSAPVLNVNDFQCFLNKFAAGC